MGKKGLPVRLNQRLDYLKFFGQAEVFKLSQCTIFRVSNSLNHYRLGITLKAPRGTLSVERSRIKRIIREEFRQISSLLGAFDYNVVVVGRTTDRFKHPFGVKLRATLSKEFPLALSKGGKTKEGKKTHG